MYRVVIVDDDRWALADIRQTFAFESRGFQIAGTYPSAEEALPAILALKPDLIVSDIRMARQSGLHMARAVRENGLESVIVLVSGYEQFDYAQEALRYGVFAYLLKPLQDDEVADVMARVALKLAGQEPAPADVFSDDSLGRAMRYIAEHYASSLPLEAVAGALFINKNYLSDLFSKKLGMTFTHYKNAVRIRHAKQLMDQGVTSLTEISATVGFDSPSRFSKVFRQLEGVSPQQYRSARIAAMRPEK
ncbi:MAG: helix-turn-helix domain-containing protein [Oscillospiraceae bacterium]|jgi:YesN/AraC family two-component response regulator|nr:helix-turn-helix domain-containing protein [Oscillospiraceae bacterium]